VSRVVVLAALILAGCAPGNFFCKGKGTLTTTAMMYNGTVTGDCGEGFLFSKGAKSLPLPPGMAPAPAPLPEAPNPKP
jgi:hypothetical protein